MELNKKNMRQLMILISFGIGLFWILSNLELVLGFLSHFIHLLLPFIIGAVIAFILNIPMTKIESFIKGKLKNKNTKLPIRTISITLSLVFFLAFILLICFLLIPELIDNIQLLIKNIPHFFENIQTWILNLAGNYPEIQAKIQEVFKDTTNVNNIMINVLNYIINGSLNFITSLISSLFTFFTAIVFAVYMLSQKEYLHRGVTKMMYAYLKKDHVEKITDIASLSNHTFSKFISGQCVEAVILGTIFFVVLTLLRFPYALIISVVTTVTALIPMFGAMIAMVIGALLIAVTSPLEAVLFIIVFQVIQQIENNFIYPKVVGKSVGLASMWTLMAVILGGSMFGIVGMIIGLPLASILYAILRKVTNDRLNKKKIKI